MNILIDTHIYLWAVSAPDKLAKKQRQALETRANTIHVSSISITEILIKSSMGKLEIAFDPVEIAISSGFELLDYSATDALQLKDLPHHHKDPFDRMLISQAIRRNYRVMSDDQVFRKYACKLV